MSLRPGKRWVRRLARRIRRQLAREALALWRRRRARMRQISVLAARSEP